jgi:hypothetical protein
MSGSAQQAVHKPSLDLQTHLAQLEANGLLVRIDRPINKDTELHPLVRCQFLGRIPEEERRAFLFSNVVDSHGRHYDIPVVVGALAASPKIYAIGMGCPVEEIGAAWMRAIANPIAPILVNSPPLSSRVTICVAPVAGWRVCRCRSRLPASTPRPISRPRFASRAIPRPESATWGRTARP